MSSKCYFHVETQRCRKSTKSSLPVSSSTNVRPKFTMSISSLPVTFHNVHPDLYLSKVAKEYIVASVNHIDSEQKLYSVLYLAGLYTLFERKKRTVQHEDIDKSLQAHTRGKSFVEKEAKRLRVSA